MMSWNLPDHWFSHVLERKFPYFKKLVWFGVCSQNSNEQSVESIQLIFILISLLLEPFAW